MALDPTKTMSWRNLLWVCTDCNRRKGARFDPDLINPFESDPWRHFVFVEASGEIAPRWIDRFTEDRSARATFSILPALGHEAVTEGRRRTYVRLRSAAEAWLRSPGDRHLREDLVRAFREDEFGVGAWVLAYEGRQQPPWPSARAVDPDLVRRLQALCC